MVGRGGVFALVVVLLAGAMFAQPARAAENRVALVIGNARYGAVPALVNPPRDAARVAEALRATGFQSVVTVADAGRPELIAALNRFSELAERADWALVYYAGHGIELGGINYLVPVDARLRSDRDIGDEAVPLERVLQSIDAAKKLRLVILDACRDNPFSNTMRRTIATRSIGRGLARIEPEGGTLVAFAAKHGQTAFDGEGGNSPFVAALSRRIATPGLEINKVFRLVRDDVMAATDRQQEPFVYGSLPGEDFYFVPGGAALAAVQAPIAPNLSAALPATGQAAPGAGGGVPVSPSVTIGPGVRLGPGVRIGGVPAEALAATDPTRIAALPPAAAPRAETQAGGNPLVTAPLVGFTRSSAGWHANVSLPEPAIALSWRLGESGPFRETGYLDAIDQRTRRRLPNPTIALDADTPAGTLYLRYLDASGASAGPFPVPFEPGSALAREQRRIMEMVSGSWLSFREFNGVLLYYTSLASYRCGIKELRIGLDRPDPDRTIALPPCDEKNPFAIPGDFLPYMKVPPGTRAATAQVVYRDGTISPVTTFRR